MRNMTKPLENRLQKKKKRLSGRVLDNDSVKYFNFNKKRIDSIKEANHAMLLCATAICKNHCSMFRHCVCDSINPFKIFKFQKT